MTFGEKYMFGKFVGLRGICQDTWGEAGGREKGEDVETWGGERGEIMEKNNRKSFFCC